MTPDQDDELASKLAKLNDVASVGSIIEGAVGGGVAGALGQAIGGAVDDSGTALDLYIASMKEGFIRNRGLHFYFKLHYEICELKRCLFVFRRYDWTKAQSATWRQGVTGMDPAIGAFADKEHLKSHAVENVEAYMQWLGVEDFSGSALKGVLK